LNAVIQTISTEVDSGLLINIMRTGDQIPQDYFFEEKVLLKEVESKSRSGARKLSTAEETKEEVNF
jgi:hypothetical protein